MPLLLIKGISWFFKAKKFGMVTNRQKIVLVALSMATFFYDALLSFGSKWKDFALNDIRAKYKKMLDSGATTFWETEEGWRAFENEGSLCHGWSAMPIYYFELLSNFSK